MKAATIKFLLAVLVFSTMQAQPPRRFYTKFGGAGDEIAYSGRQTLDGHYIVAGSSTSYGTNGQADMYLLKVDSMGKMLWVKYIGGMNNDVAKAVIQLPDSGFVLAGYTNSYGGGGYDAFIVRTDKSGVSLWEKTFGGADWDFANDVVLATDKSLVVVGYSSGAGTAKKDGFVLKYDLNGNLLAQKTVGGAENEELRSVIVTNDSMLATVGYTESRGEINGDMYFLKLKLSLDTVFTKTIGGPYKDYANDVVQKVDSRDYHVCGAGTFTANAKTESYIHVMDSDGVKLREMHDRRRIEENEEFISATNSLHHDYLTGYVRTVVFGGVKKQVEIYVLIPLLYASAINNNGGYEDEYVFSVEATKDGGYLCVGQTASFESQGTDAYLMKYDTLVAGNNTILDVGTVSRPEPVISYLNSTISIFLEQEIIQEVFLSGMDGKEFHRAQCNSPGHTFSTADLDDGIFILKVFTAERVYTRKLLISR